MTRCNEGGSTNRVPTTGFPAASGAGPDLTEFDGRFLRGHGLVW
jgi:hypothetical protein